MTRQEILNKTIDFDDAIERIVSLEKQIDELKQENLENESEAREVNIRFDKLLKKYMKAKEILQTVLDKWKEERWILQSEEEVRMIERLMEQAEQFLSDSKQEE